MKQSMIKIPHKLKKIVSVQPSMDSLMMQLQQELPLMEMPMSPWKIASIVLSICGGIICAIIGVYCWYHKRFQKRIMERRSKGQCVRFAKDDNDTSHSRAVAVLGGGRDYPRCNVGITCDEKRDEYGGNAVRYHPNTAYEMVELHDDDVTTLDGATGDISEKDGTKQKKPSVSQLHDSQRGQEMSVGYVVRDSRRKNRGELECWRGHFPNLYSFKDVLFPCVIRLQKGSNTLRIGILALNEKYLFMTGWYMNVSTWDTYSEISLMSLNEPRSWTTLVLVHM